MLTACVDYEDATQPLQTTSVRLIKPELFTDNSALANRTITLKAGTSTLTATTNA